MKKVLAVMAATMLVQPLLLTPTLSVASGGAQMLAWSGTCGRFGNGTNNRASVINRCSYPISACWMTSETRKGYVGPIAPGNVVVIPVDVFRDATQVIGWFAPAGTPLDSYCG
ncbi:hypothetical protein K9B32_16490 [Rhizobium sp. 3T7]|uniref:hypothetical protein n=1 Tax=Rhizobium sp. 3T7 TaxID=2874922 RepID=UPI001CC971D0|nr:hypothetical protein [Rhizobium sp. 3T7]MBZ9791702.1 hypothetical protein [Rhizobium sp. 3T7]